jgi:hypothetical protein
MAYLLDMISVRITIETTGEELISELPPYLARQLPVQKVVPTLTSRCIEIGLSMAGAKQQGDMSFILVPAVSRTSSSLRSWRSISMHRGAHRGGYKRGGRGGDAPKSLLSD